MTTKVFGSSIKRREDPRLITGQGNYVDDIKLVGMLHAVFVRSPHAHAKIKSVETSKAEALEGVVAVTVGNDEGVSLTVQDHLARRIFVVPDEA